MNIGEMNRLLCRLLEFIKFGLNVENGSCPVTGTECGWKGWEKSLEQDFDPYRF